MIPRGVSPKDDRRPGSVALVGGALALDFANTASGRGGPQHRDHLQTAVDLVDWACHAGVLSEEAGSRLRAKLDAGDPAFSGLLADALAVREAVHRIVSALARRAKPQAADLAILSARCAGATAAATLEMDADGAKWRWPADDPMPETVLGPIVLSAVGLLRESDPARLKQCSGEHCGWVFFDATKNRSRRWCEMSVCGNRAKARTHYRRARMLAEAVA